MTLLVTIAFIMAVAGCFIMLELSPFAFLEGLSGYLRPKNHSMKNRIKESKKKKEPKGLKLLFEEIKEILRLTGKSEQFIMLCVLAMILFVLGVMIALTMNNVLMVPVLAVGFALLPFYYVKFTASKHKKQINTELETALSMITTSYLRNKNTIIRAIEENLPYLNPPVSEVFRNFLMEAKLINSNTAEALEGLKKGMDNAVFHEWVDAVVACQDDYELRVEKEQIERTIWTIWQEHCRLFATIPVASLYEQQIEKLRKQEKILKQSLERFPAEKINLYEQFCSSRVKQDMFLKEKDQLSKQEEVVRKEIEKVSGQIDMLEKRQKNYQCAADLVERYRTSEALTEEFMSEMVEKIVVYEDKRIEIVWKYREEFEEIL